MNLLAQGLAFSCVEASLSKIASRASNMCHLIGFGFETYEMSQTQILKKSRRSVLVCDCHVASQAFLFQYAWTLQTLRHARVRRRRNEDPLFTDAWCEVGSSNGDT
jgi:hypothetical protein